MITAIDSLKFLVTCDDCNEQVKTTVQWLDEHRLFACSGCGRSIEVTVDDIRNSHKYMLEHRAQFA